MTANGWRIDFLGPTTYLANTAGFGNPVKTFTNSDGRAAAARGARADEEVKRPLRAASPTCSTATGCTCRSPSCTHTASTERRHRRAPGRVSGSSRPGHRRALPGNNAYLPCSHGSSAAADMSGQWPSNRLETSPAYTGHMSEPDWAPLTGFRVAVTSARRADELSALLQRRGASVTSAAAIAMVPLPDDDELRAHTEALIDVPPDIVIATTGIGFRGWVAAADGWGLTNELITALGKAPRRVPRAEGDRRAAGRGPARGMVAGIGVVAGAAALPCRGRHRRPAHRGATARRDRGMGSVPRVSRRAARRRRRCGADPGVSLAPAPRNGDLRPTGGRNRRREVRRGELHVGARCRVGADARRAKWASRTGFSSALPHRCARDVRRPGDRAPAGATGRADVGARANAAGRVGPSHHRRAAAAAVTHHTGGRPPAGDPRHLRAWSTAWSRRSRRPGWRRSARSPTVRARWCPVPTCSARCPAAAPTPTRWRRPCCGCERRWATRTSSRRWSSAATGWPSTNRVGPGPVSRVLVAHGTRKHDGVDDDRRSGATACPRPLGREVHVSFVDVLGPTPSKCFARLPATNR